MMTANLATLHSGTRTSASRRAAFVDPVSLRWFRRKLEQSPSVFKDANTLVVTDPVAARDVLAFRPAIFEDRALLGTGLAHLRDHRSQFRAFASTLSGTSSFETHLAREARLRPAPDAFVVAALDEFGAAVVGRHYAELRDAAIPFVLDGINRHYRRNRDSLRRARNEAFFQNLARFHEQWDEPETLAYQIATGPAANDREEVARLVGAGLMSVSAPPGVAASWLAYETRPGGLMPELDSTWRPGDVANEILRLRPPAWNHGRRVITSGHVAGVRVRPGEEVLVPVGFLHTTERYWQRPLVFDQTRWVSRAPRDEVFYPFGVGRRSCVGAALGQRFLELTWHALLSWEVRAAPVRPSRFRVGPLYGPPNFTLVGRRAFRSA